MCTQQHARGVKPSFIILVMSACCGCAEYAVGNGGLTVVEDIKDFCSAILCNAGKHLPIAASGNAYDSGRVGTVVFYEFDPLFLFLPQFDVTVD